MASRDEASIICLALILGATLHKKFAPEVADLSGPITRATIEIYNMVRADLLPTPAKSHYTFNLRDLARVFQAGACTRSLQS
jgi:dynein heavy chain